MWQNAGVMIKAQLIDSSISIFLSSKNILILPGHISSRHNQGVEHIHSLFQARAASWVYKAHSALWESLLVEENGLNTQGNNTCITSFRRVIKQ